MPILRIFGIIPLGIGLTVLGSLWLAPFNQFGSPPVFFRIFGSFIALGFILQGTVMVFGLGTPASVMKNLTGPFSKLADLASTLSENSREPRVANRDACPRCAAPLEGSAEVSPHGDVKCGHCGKWFNVYGR
jgi:hypothetical protein